jgi:ACS family hexuronate transporter-like MFS transporter
MRFLLGILVSATEPFAFSLIGDYFPRKIRTTANSVFGTGGYLGSASSVMFLYVTKELGWRWAYILSGSLGLIIGVISLIFIKEPRKGLQNYFELQEL